MSKRARPGDIVWAVVCRTPSDSPYPIIPGGYYGIELDPELPLKPARAGVAFSSKEGAEAHFASLPKVYTDTGRPTDFEVAHVKIQYSGFCIDVVDVA